MDFKLLILFITVASLTAVAFVYLSSWANLLHLKLDEIEEQAKIATTQEELTDAAEALNEISHKCWHRTFAMREAIIRTLIVAKIEIYRERDRDREE